MKLVVNFKTYMEASGKNAVKLAKICSSVSKSIIVCVQAADINMVSSKVKIPVYAQHVDDIEQGANTGYISIEDVKVNGAVGALLNHAEHRIKFNKLISTIKRCRKLDFKVIVCTDKLSEAKKLKKLKPYAIAFEDPKLIGTGNSITRARTSDIKKFAKMLKHTEILALCGAGISSREDAVQAKKLGADGVLVASGIVKAKNPRKIISSLL